MKTKKNSICLEAIERKKFGSRSELLSFLLLYYYLYTYNFLNTITFLIELATVTSGINISLSDSKK